MSSNQQGLIGEDFIRSLLEKTDLVHLIQQSVPLKKAGANYVACCPFHSEKSPSFTVSPVKQFFHCFGCGANGDAISFIRKHQGLDFIEAIELLAGAAGLPLPQQQRRPNYQSEQLKPYSQVLADVSQYYQQALKQHPDKTKPVDYLKSRGITGITAKTFGIGFAPTQWDNLVYYWRDKPEQQEKLERLGLVIKHAKGHFFDRFRNRIMFPIRTRKGEVIGFGGRVIDSQDTPKYMNSPESVVFKKGQQLYGIYEALARRTEWDTAICVEGYLDVIGLYQHGVYGAFATMGTAFTESHIRQLFKLANKIVFCFDGDKAGRNAAWKALETIFPVYQAQKQIKFLFLPDSEDPDSYIKSHGKQKFWSLLSQSLSFSEYFFSELCQRHPPSNVENRAQLITVGKQYIAQLPDETYKQLMDEALAQLTTTSQQVIKQPYNKRPYSKQGQGRFSQKYFQNNNTKGKGTPPPAPLGPAYIASALLILQPDLGLDLKFQPMWEHYNIPGLSLLQTVLSHLASHSHQEAEAVISMLMDRGFTRNLVQPCLDKAMLIPEKGRKEELMGALERIMVIGQEQIIENLLKNAQKRELTLEEKNCLKNFLQSRESSG
tara:strand:+ start:24889 stop:26700 length:1812 start_codon:yes stop_codon:yes gene_type:complete